VHGFGGKQHADAVGHAAESFGVGLHVAQLDERVLHQRVIDDLDGHAGSLYTHSDFGLRAAK
jgi:hypothetical protein